MSTPSHPPHALPLSPSPHPSPQVQRDRVYAEAMGQVASFRFDEGVTRVFPDMIARSVPGYAATLSAAAALARRFAQPHTRLYDLGCSRGACLSAMAGALKGRLNEGPFELVGVDTSPAMLSACKRDLSAEGLPHEGINLELIEGDIRETPLQDASVVVLNFTLQFVPVADRLALLKRAREALRPGGVLLLSEKIELEDPALNALCIDLHHDFKRAQGYSDLEVAQKRDALVDVLVPESIEAHRARLREAGFSAAEVWYQVFNFCSLVALTPTTQQRG